MKYQERPTETFWRVFYVYGAIVLIGLSLALAVAPLALIYYYPVAWLIPLLVFVAIGGFGVYWFTNSFRQLFWKERHHSRYEVTATHIEGVTYRHESGESVEQSFPLNDILQVVFFPAIVRKTQPSPTVRFGRPTIEFCPMLAIMTEDDSMEILFDQHDLAAFEQWIQYFDERDISLFYTPKQLYWIGANISTRWERFERLRQPEEIIPFTYTGDIVTDEQTAAGLWVETHGSERLNEGPHQAYYEKQRMIMKWTFFGTLIGIALLIGSMFAIAALT
jgi:hypothetical protein